MARSGEFILKVHKIYYAGNMSKRHENRNLSIVNKSMQSAVVGYITQSDKIIMLKLRGTPFHINIIHVCAPDKRDGEVETFYNQIRVVMKTIKN